MSKRTDEKYVKNTKKNTTYPENLHRTLQHTDVNVFVGANSQSEPQFFNTFLSTPNSFIISLEIRSWV